MQDLLSVIGRADLENTILEMFSYELTQYSNHNIRNNFPLKINPVLYLLIKLLKENNLTLL